MREWSAVSRGVPAGGRVAQAATIAIAKAPAKKSVARES